MEMEMERTDTSQDKLYEIGTLDNIVEQVYDDQKYTKPRLPINVRPWHYDLKLAPDFEKFTFEGHVKIVFRDRKEPEVGSIEDQIDIVIHALDLKITDGLLLTGNCMGRLKKVTYSETSETATLTFKTEYRQSRQRDWYESKRGLQLSFTGNLNDNLKGFYRTSFKLEDKLVYAGVTQFATTDARRSFPCFDEPIAKASFSLQMIYNDKLPIPELSNYKVIALSNTPVIESTKVDGKDGVKLVSTKFAKTPEMSTYLLAFAVGPFEYVEMNDGKRPIRVYTTIGKKEQGRFALEVAAKSLAFYENYFDIPYPLKKMDLIAVPDLSYGAMENWGLITYRESVLLVDPGNSSTLSKQYCAIVVAHELAHQWFGNLVTMQWWTDLWLNEGFATFMEYLCIDKIYPEWDIWAQFVSDQYSRALALDALHNSHPIEVEVENSADINEIFDEISYNKGGSVLRMVYTYIGDDCFRKGLKRYLQGHSYSNATTKQLWMALEYVSGKPIKQIMSGWTSQKGFPWILIDCSKGGDETKLTLTQNKFSGDGRASSEENDNTWMIPIEVITSADPSCPQSLGLLESKSGTFSLQVKENEWLKLNPGTIGLYRTFYPETMAKKLWPAIKDQSLPPMDRLGIQNDLFALSQASIVKTVDLLKLLEFYEEETNYTVWSSIDCCVGKLGILISNTDYRDKFCDFGRKLYSSIYNKLGWDARADDKHTDAMTRAIVVNRLVSFCHQDVIEECKRRFKACLSGETSIPADLRGPIYRAAAVYGDDDSFSSLFEMHQATELQEEKNRIEGALGYVTDPARINQVTKFILSDAVRSGDKRFPIASMSATNPAVAWQMLKDNKDWFREKLSGTVLMARLVKNITENLASEEMASEVEIFFETNKFPGIERSIQQAIEAIRNNVAWLDRECESVRAYLSA